MEEKSLLQRSLNRHFSWVYLELCEAGAPGELLEAASSLAMRSEISGAWQDKALLGALQTDAEDLSAAVESYLRDHKVTEDQNASYREVRILLEGAFRLIEAIDRMRKEAAHER